nr:hypothetical protein HmN_000895700 [Hymenolepis microstoma]
MIELNGLHFFTRTLKLNGTLRKKRPQVKHGHTTQDVGLIRGGYNVLRLTESQVSGVSTRRKLPQVKQGKDTVKLIEEKGIVDLLTVNVILRSVKASRTLDTSAELRPSVSHDSNFIRCPRTPCSVTYSRVALNFYASKLEHMPNSLSCVSVTVDDRQVRDLFTMIEEVVVDPRVVKVIKVKPPVLEMKLRLTVLFQSRVGKRQIVIVTLIPIFFTNLLQLITFLKGLD